MRLDGKMGDEMGMRWRICRYSHRKAVCGGWCVERPAWGFSLFFTGFRDFNYPGVLEHCQE